MSGQGDAVRGAPARLGSEEHLLQPLLDGRLEAAAECAGARPVVHPQRRQPGPRILAPALGQPLDQAGRERHGIGGTERLRPITCGSSVNMAMMVVPKNSFRCW